MAYYYNNQLPSYTSGNGYYQAPMQTPVPAQTYQPYSNQQYQPQSNNTGFVWVQGEAAAKAYPVAAGNCVLLMDSEAPVLYMKSTDASGRPMPIETYDLVKRETIVQTQSRAQADLSEYVKMTDLETKVKEIVNRALEQ